jgi:molecular chaperone HtpG
LTKTIRKQVIKKVLDMLEDMAANRPDDFTTFTDKYGVVLKEGVHAEPKMKDRIAKLLRFGTSLGDDLTSLAEYIERMPEGQSDIIYALGPNRAMLDASPHLEQVRAKGWEVLYLTDPIDQWVVDSLQTFDEKTLVNAMSTELDLGDEDGGEGDAKDGEATDETPKLGGLATRVQELLDEHIAEVRVSKRLAGSPACLVVPKGGLAAHIERALRAQHAGLPPQKRILELNPEHPIVKNLERLAESDATGETVNSWIHMLYDHALITEGSPLQDPARFAKALGDLLETATTQAVGDI